jgi:hypothetical protein
MRPKIYESACGQSSGKKRLRLTISALIIIGQSAAALRGRFSFPVPADVVVKARSISLACDEIKVSLRSIHDLLRRV